MLLSGLSQKSAQPGSSCGLWLACLGMNCLHHTTFVGSQLFNLLPACLQTAIGHWLDSLFPLFSALLHEPGAFKRSPDHLLLLHQKRGFVFEWVRALLAVALGVRRGQGLPPLIFQQEHDDPWEQAGVRLEGVGPTDWVCFERVLWIKVRWHPCCMAECCLLSVQLRSGIPSPGLQCLP